MQVGVLAVQGAFAEMEAYWREEGADVFEIRQLADLGRPMDLLALPGGESTVQGKLLNDLGLFDPIKKLVDGGLPVFATCAGLILLAEKIDDPGRRDATRPEKWFGVLPVAVKAVMLRQRTEVGAPSNVESTSMSGESKSVIAGARMNVIGKSCLPSKSPRVVKLPSCRP